MAIIISASNFCSLIIFVALLTCLAVKLEQATCIMSLRNYNAKPLLRAQPAGCNTSDSVISVAIDTREHTDSTGPMRICEPQLSLDHPLHILHPNVCSANTLQNGFQCTPNNRAYMAFPMVATYVINYLQSIMTLDSRLCQLGNMSSFFFYQLAELTLLLLPSHIATCISGNSLLTVTAAWQHIMVSVIQHFHRFFRLVSYMFICDSFSSSLNHTIVVMAFRFLTNTQAFRNSSQLEQFVLPGVTPTGKLLGTGVVWVSGRGKSFNLTSHSGCICMT